ncbi:MAG: RHS repeat-associated core domain-containing protein [Polyangia bacterium]
MAEAARVTDPVVHSSALLGFLIGAVIGIALILAVAVFPFSCLFVGIVAGLAASIAAPFIAKAGEAIGRMCTSKTGMVSTGSFDVFVNNLPSAFVAGSAVLCSKDVPGHVIADGSSNVFINNFPASRKDDHATCDAKIDDGSPNVFIDGGTVRYLPVEEEIPEWLRTAVDWAFTLAGLATGIVGLVRNVFKFGLRAAAPCIAKFIGGFIISEAIGRYIISPAVNRAIGGLVGNPVDITTGRKVLLAHDETDFELICRLPLVCSRFYASDLTYEGSLGRGWVLPWELRLEEVDGQIRYVDAQGRQMLFPWVEPGQCVFSEAEGRYLACTRDGRYVLYDLSEAYCEFGPLQAGGSAFLRRQEDQTGQWLAYERDDVGRLLFIRTSGGQRVQLSHGSPQGRLTSIDLVEGGTPGPLVRYDYDDHGQLVRVTDASGRVTRRFQYADGRMVQHVNAAGLQCDYRWEEIGGAARVVEHTTSEGERYLFRYDIEGRKSSVQDELGRRAEWRFDDHRQITACTDLDGSQYRFEYTAAGHLSVMHLPGERVVRFEYDPLGRLVKETDPLGRVTTTAYSGKSLRVTRLALPDASSFRAEYDLRGQMLTSSDPLGRKQRYIYGDDALPHTFIDARGGQKSLTWNVRGQLESYTDCSGKTTRYEYDTDGHLVAVIDASGARTAYRTSRTGEVSAIVLPNGQVEQFEYDAAGRLSRYRNAAAQVQSWQYNARSQVTAVTDPTQRTLHYSYDARGRLRELRNASQARYLFEYDTGDRLIREVRPDGVEKRMQHDVAGGVIAVETVGSDEGEKRRPEGAQERAKKVLRFDRDAMGRLLAKHSETATTLYTWDVCDRLLQARKDPTELGKLQGVVEDQVSFEYDAAGQLTREVGVHGAVTYERDELGNVAALTLPQGQRIDQLSYGSGHVHQIRMGDRVISDFERDDLHREILRTQGRLTCRLGYDALGRPSWQSAGLDAQHLGPQQGTLWRRYEYDRAGELVTQQDSVRGEIRYEYDPAGQIRRRFRSNDALDEHFVWDAAGNLLGDGRHKSVGLIQNHRLRIFQDLRFEYDAFGNLTMKKKGAAQEQSFVFDAEDRLIAVRTRNHWRPWGEIEARFDYDALGRRIASTETARGVTGERQIKRNRFVWQGLRMVQELRETGISTYVYNPDADYSPLARIDQPLGPDGALGPGRTQVFHFQTDAIGTPLEVTNESGQLAWAGRYQTWGKIDRPEDETPALIDQPLRFPGQYADEATGLHYNTFRFYDPDTGRYISQDPIGLEGGAHLYRYVPNPVSWLDPLGLQHLNTNSATGNFGVYEIFVNGELYKYGKTDMSRVTQETGLPTRLHQQLRKLKDIYGAKNVNGRVIESGFKTTADAKAVETSKLDAFYRENNGKVPEGNKRSYKPKQGGC